ncbi:MAG TPA: NAD-dependent DNA ligase LigA, partial [Bacteroidales bacterium]|nr:NAD-dependent DNA ligase LigA [Bacteroidales bacterium]
KQKVVGGKLANMSFCLTGSLVNYDNRDELIKVIEANGGKIAGVNKNLTYLICNDKTSTSGKSKKAKELGIKIITEDEFNTLLNN